MNYSRQQHLSAPLTAKAELWRTVIGVVLIGTLYIALLITFFGIAALTLGADENVLAQFQLATQATPGFTIALLYSFLAMIASVAIVSRFLHKVNVVALIGPLPTAARDFGRVIRVLIIVYIVISLLSWAVGTPGPEPEVNVPFSKWLSLLPFALLGLFVQTGAEELAFRGYLQGQLAARFRSPFVWMVIPAFIFAIGHYAPEEYGENAWVVVLWTSFFGLAAADLTARTGTIGAALGFHFMNNLGAILLVSVSGPLSGLALYTFPFDGTDTALMSPLLLIDLGVLIVSWLACRLACRV